MLGEKREAVSMTNGGSRDERRKVKLGRAGEEGESGVKIRENLLDSSFTNSHNHTHTHTHTHSPHNHTDTKCNSLFNYM